MESSAFERLATLAGEVLRLLAQADARIVLAESCTAGMVSAALGRIPGISHYLCGSAVTYREATKSQWLGVPKELIESKTTVSREVTEAMARGVLLRTPEAALSAAITGHLGPSAPDRLDGQIFLAISLRTPGGQAEIALSTAHRLSSTARFARQLEAAEFVLRTVCDSLNEHSNSLADVTLPP
jgi:PncC family amidohydrolase